jgi:hypothetical protein
MLKNPGTGSKLKVFSDNASYPKWTKSSLKRVKKGVASHFPRELSIDECLDFPQKAIQKNGVISSPQGLF